MNYHFTNISLTQTLEITNSIFGKFKVHSANTKVFNFYYLSTYSSSDFNIKFNNCTFRNNVGFVAMIHCDYRSNCQISIQDSTFSNNNGGYYNCVSVFFLILMQICQIKYCISPFVYHCVGYVLC